MCLLLESISLRDGVVERLPYHQQRMDEAVQQLYQLAAPRLWPELNKLDLPVSGHYKIRVTFEKTILDIEIIPYHKKQINSLQVLFSDTIDYSLKYTRRKELDKLYQQRGSADDILIIKNGLVTDTYYCNILFHDGREWITPLQPLLKGTMRQYLINTGAIRTTDISVTDLYQFKKAKLINALFGFMGPEIEIEDILF